jgi:hypothetical protein
MDNDCVTHDTTAVAPPGPVRAGPASSLRQVPL